MRLTDRATIEKYVSDGSYDDQAGWETVDTVPVKVIPKDGTETVEGQQVVALHDYEVMMRYREDVDEANRLRWQPAKGPELILNIKAAKLLRPRAWWWQLGCVKGSE